MITKELLPTRKSKSRCFLLILLLGLIYIFENLKLLNNSIFIYYINPLLWLGIAFVVWKLPNIRPNGRLKLKKLINLWAFNFAIIYVIVSVISGLFIDGLGKSPYDHSLIGILANIFLISALLIGREFARSYLTNSLLHKENYLMIVAIALLMTFTAIPFKQFSEPKEMMDVIKFFSQYFIPELCQNLFATYLVYLGGATSSIIYLGIIRGFNWFSLVLPNLQWITTVLIGVLCPIFFLMSLRNIYFEATKEIKIHQKDKESPWSWMATSIISIAIIWFSVGVFPIYPSVVVTGSMEPMIKPGDVILVNKINGCDVQVGDVIQFKQNGILISHRIVEIKEADKVKQYRTKGDNNAGPDLKWVKPEAIKGKIISVVPKAGWFTMVIKSKNLD